MDSLVKEILSELEDHGTPECFGSSAKGGEILETTKSRKEQKQIQAFQCKEESREVTNNGLVSIQDGNITITAPRNNGKYPTIAPGQHVRVFVNGEEVSGTTVVTENDDVIVLPDEEDPEVDYVLEVDEELMNAHLSVRYKPGKKYKIVDSPPVEDLVITAKLDREIPPSRLDYCTVLEELVQKNIVYFDEQKIKKLLASGKNLEREKIAQGIYPTPPVDEEVEYIFQQKHISSSSGGNRPVKNVLSVKPGEVLAVKKPAVLGEPGIDLTGAVKDPREPKRVEIKVRRGVQLIEDGTKAVALIEGRPDVSNGYLSVFPIYDHVGDVTPETGDIEFNGDVLITGNVEDFMIVRASGNVSVNGYVANSKIYAGGNITVKGNIIGSTLFAGGMSALCKEICHYLNDVDIQLQKLVKAINQLKKKYGQKELPVGRAVKALLEKKFTKLPKLCVSFAKSMEQREEYEVLDASVKDLIDELAVTFYAYGPIRELRRMKDLLTLKKKVKEAIYFLESLANKHSSIYGNYVQSSTLVASADIIISGEGCFQSSLRAGNNVCIKGNKGIFKGGEVIANGNIQIVEAGSEIGCTTKLKTTAENSVEINQAWPGVEINVGGMKKTYVEKETNVCFFISEKKT
ncbi:MAG: DUF342 domain-containing protein [Thermoanaerobacteraceae bacterium]|nr:DUF342 domain-containing protein [Thermoanaerobacteraceae bacterium]